MSNRVSIVRSEESGVAFGSLKSGQCFTFLNPSSAENIYMKLGRGPSDPRDFSCDMAAVNLRTGEVYGLNVDRPVRPLPLDTAIHIEVGCGR